MKKLLTFFSVMVLVVGLAAAVPASAETSKSMGHGKSSDEHHRMNSTKKAKEGHRGGHRTGHVFGPHWRGTLTDHQKMLADEMHLALKKSMSILKAHLELKKTELNNIVIQDNPDKKAIHSKIDEILDLKKDIMRTKYDHVVEMRDMLTLEQRVSFDMGMLGRGKQKKRHSHH